MIAKAMEFIRHNPRREIDLLWILTQEQITLQYKRTWLGIIWSLLNPLLLACIFYIAFTIVLKVKSQDFSLFLLAGLFPWTWFTNSVSGATVSLIANKTLIKKFPFPKPFLLISGILSEGVHFLFSLPIIILFGFYYGKCPDWTWLVGIPILLLTQLLIILGVSLAVSVINVYFRDFQFVVNFMLTLLFWLTPIIYQFETIPEAYRPLFLYGNPLTSLIISWREIFLRNHLRWDLFLLALSGSFVILLLGLLIYQKLNKRVDELL